MSKGFYPTDLETKSQMFTLSSVHTFPCRALRVFALGESLSDFTGIRWGQTIKTLPNNAVTTLEYDEAKRREPYPTAWTTTIKTTTTNLRPTDVWFDELLQVHDGGFEAGQNEEGGQGGRVDNADGHGRQLPEDGERSATVCGQVNVAPLLTIGKK